MSCNAVNFLFWQYKQIWKLTIIRRLQLMRFWASVPTLWRFHDGKEEHNQKVLKGDRRVNERSNLFVGAKQIWKLTTIRRSQCGPKCHLYSDVNFQDNKKQTQPNGFEEIEEYERWYLKNTT